MLAHARTHAQQCSHLSDYSRPGLRACRALQPLRNATHVPLMQCVFQAVVMKPTSQETTHCCGDPFSTGTNSHNRGPPTRRQHVQLLRHTKAGHSCRNVGVLRRACDDY